MSSASVPGGCRGQGDAEPERRARGHGVRPVGHG